MTTSFFGLDQKITFEGADSANPFAFKHYNPTLQIDRLIMKISICNE